MITIETADPRSPAIAALVAELDAFMAALYPAESNHLLDIETLARPQMRFFAALQDGAAAGCGGCWLHRDYAEIKRVYVRPAARGSGLARGLMARIEDEARLNRKALARLETGIRQPEALGLYRALGYRECRSFGGYPASDRLSVFMEKAL